MSPRISNDPVLGLTVGAKGQAANLCLAGTAPDPTGRSPRLLGGTGLSILPHRAVGLYGGNHHLLDRRGRAAGRSAVLRSEWSTSEVLSVNGWCQSLNGSSRRSLILSLCGLGLWVEEVLPLCFVDLSTNSTEQNFVLWRDY